jgi:hypothetical protein
LTGLRRDEPLVAVDRLAELGEVARVGELARAPDVADEIALLVSSAT